MNAAEFDAAMVDLDGTMVDTAADITAALNGMLAELALEPVDRSQVEPLIGGGADHLVLAILSLQGALGSKALFEDARLRYRAQYDAVNGKHSSVYPGVAEGLERLAARGVRLACVTNKPTLLARGLLRDKGLERFFAEVMGGDRSERLKPDPQPLLDACAALGTAPARTLMIGDSVNDARAARAAGCPVVLVTYGYNHGEPVRGVNADGFVDSLAEVAG